MEKYENITEVIAENLIYYRKANGFTQAQLAEKLNYSDKTISKWERGDGLPDILVFCELAKIYGLSVNDFLVKSKKVKLSKFNLSKIVILLSSIVIVWLVATILFAALKIFTELDKLWLIFIYAIPLSCIVWAIFDDIFFKRYYNILPVTIAIWTIPLALFYTFTLPHKYLFFIVAIPIQVLFALFYFLLWRKKKVAGK